ncbi:MAG: flagellar export protein FliJ [Hyphomicrobiales bacterium]
MTARGYLIRFERLADEQGRKLSRIQWSIHEFSKEAAELDLEIAAEEARAGIGDPKHFAYPSYAKAAAARRDNLRRSVEQLRLQLEKVSADHREALADLREAELLEDGRAAEAPGREVRDEIGMGVAFG